MTLLSPPIAERSIEFRLASQKWRQLQNKISRDSEGSAEVIDLDTAFLGISPNSNNNLSKLPDNSSEKNKKAQQT